MLRRRKGCKLLSRDKLERGLRRLTMMEVKIESVMKMGKLEKVLMEKRITMKMELVVERKDWGQEELSRPEKTVLFVSLYMTVQKRQPTHRENYLRGLGHCHSGLRFDQVKCTCRDSSV